MYGYHKFLFKIVPYSLTRVLYALFIIGCRKWCHNFDHKPTNTTTTWNSHSVLRDSNIACHKSMLLLNESNQFDDGIFKNNKTNHCYEFYNEKPQSKSNYGSPTRTFPCCSCVDTCHLHVPKNLSPHYHVLRKSKSISKYKIHNDNNFDSKWFPNTFPNNKSKIIPNKTNIKCHVKISKRNAPPNGSKICSPFEYHASMYRNQCEHPHDKLDVHSPCRQSKINDHDCQSHKYNYSSAKFQKLQKALPHNQQYVSTMHENGGRSSPHSLKLQKALPCDQQSRPIIKHENGWKSSPCSPKLQKTLFHDQQCGPTTKHENGKRSSPHLPRLQKALPHNQQHQPIMHDNGWKSSPHSPRPCCDANTIVTKQPNMKLALEKNHHPWNEGSQKPMPINDEPTRLKGKGDSHGLSKYDDSTTSNGFRLDNSHLKLTWRFKCPNVGSKSCHSNLDHKSHGQMKSLPTILVDDSNSKSNLKISPPLPSLHNDNVSTKKRECSCTFKSRKKESLKLKVEDPYLLHAQGYDQQQQSSNTKLPIKWSIPNSPCQHGDIGKISQNDLKFEECTTHQRDDLEYSRLAQKMDSRNSSRDDPCKECITTQDVECLKLVQEKDSRSSPSCDNPCKECTATQEDKYCKLAHEEDSRSSSLCGNGCMECTTNEEDTYCKLVKKKDSRNSFSCGNIGKECTTTQEDNYCKLAQEKDSRSSSSCECTTSKSLNYQSKNCNFSKEYICTRIQNSKLELDHFDNPREKYSRSTKSDFNNLLQDFNQNKKSNTSQKQFHISETGMKDSSCGIDPSKEIMYTTKSQCKNKSNFDLGRSCCDNPTKENTTTRSHNSKTEYETRNSSPSNSEEEDITPRNESHVFKTKLGPSLYNISKECIIPEIESFGLAKTIESKNSSPYNNSKESITPTNPSFGFVIRVKSRSCSPCNMSMECTTPINHSSQISTSLKSRSSSSNNILMECITPKNESSPISKHFKSWNSSMCEPMDKSNSTKNVFSKNSSKKHIAPRSQYSRLAKPNLMRLFPNNPPQKDNSLNCACSRLVDPIHLRIFPLHKKRLKKNKIKQSICRCEGNYLGISPLVHPSKECIVSRNEDYISEIPKSSISSPINPSYKGIASKNEDSTFEILKLNDLTPINHFEGIVLKNEVSTFETIKLNDSFVNNPSKEYMDPKNEDLPFKIVKVTNNSFIDNPSKEGTSPRNEAYAFETVQLNISSMENPSKESISSRNEDYAFETVQLNIPSLDNPSKEHNAPRSENFDFETIKLNNYFVNNPCKENINPKNEDFSFEPIILNNFAINNPSKECITPRIEKCNVEIVQSNKTFMDGSSKENTNPRSQYSTLNTNDKLMDLSIYDPCKASTTTPITYLNYEITENDKLKNPFLSGSFNANTTSRDHLYPVVVENDQLKNISTSKTRSKERATSILSQYSGFAEMDWKSSSPYCDSKEHIEDDVRCKHASKFDHSQNHQFKGHKHSPEGGCWPRFQSTFRQIFKTQ